MRSLLPEEFRGLLEGPLRRFYLVTFLGAVGTGLILSLFFIYVKDVRHLSSHFAGWLGTMSALLGLAIAPIVGSLTDRYGPAKVIVPGMAIQAFGLYQVAYATTKLHFIIATIFMVIGGSTYWGPASTMMTRLSLPERRQSVFGLNFMILNLGIGIGNLISALLVDKKHPSSFTHLYLMTGALEIIAGLVLMTLFNHGQPIPKSANDEHVVGGWREVLADRRLLHFLGASLVMLLCGYGSIESGFSIFVKDAAHINIKFIGLIFFFNTMTILFGQVFALRFAKGRRRTGVLGTVGMLWGASWFLLALTPHVALLFAVVLAVISTMVFAIGETLWMPTSQALVNEMAPEHVRGRYNAASGLVWGVGGAIAPQITAIFFGNPGLGKYYPLVIGSGAILGGFFIRTLRRSVTDEMDGLLNTVAR